MKTNQPISAKSRPVLVLAALTLSPVLLLGCGGGGGSSSSPSTQTVRATFSSIQSNVFTPTCAVSGCHSGGAPAQGLNLNPDNSYTMLVGVASSEQPSLLRVDPNDPDNSYLIQKLEGTASFGERMPRGGSPLSSSTIQAIRQWISEGAIDDRLEPSDPIRITSLSPIPSAELIVSPANIIIGFDRQPDASTVNAATVILTASGGDGTFTDGNETTITADSITVPPANNRSAIFDLGATSLVEDKYRLTLKGDGGSVILDLDSNALDGEFNSDLPSGNGAAGGDFNVTFDVSPLQPTLEDIQAKLFTPTCSTSSCHSGPTGNELPSGMDLSDADASFASLVGVDSIQEAAIKRVLANDPDNSYLIDKLEGTNSVGQTMPRNLPPLEPEVIAEIRQWITNGAAR